MLLGREPRELLDTELVPHFFLEYLRELLVAVTLAFGLLHVFKIDGLSIVISILEFDFAWFVVDINRTQDLVRFVCHLLFK